MSKIDNLKLRDVEVLSDSQLRSSSSGSSSYDSGGNYGSSGGNYGSSGNNAGSSDGSGGGFGFTPEQCMSQETYYEMLEKNIAVSGVYVCGMGWAISEVPSTGSRTGGSFYWPDDFGSFGSRGSYWPFGSSSGSRHTSGGGGGGGGLPNPITPSDTVKVELPTKLQPLFRENGNLNREQMDRLVKLFEEMLEDCGYATIQEYHDTKDNLWNFLYFTGYLTKVSEHLDENDVISMKLRIPNKEVKSVYKSSIRIWFDRKCSQLALADLLPALESGEAAALEQIVTNVLMLSISAFDYGETFYHGLMIGLLSHLDGFYLTSNRESGDGRFDVQMKSRTRWDLSFLFEFKIAGEFKDLEKRAKEALVQIDEKHYDAELLSEGHEEPKKYGIAFCKKRCKVLCEDKAAYPPTL